MPKVGGYESVGVDIFVAVFRAVHDFGEDTDRHFSSRVLLGQFGVHLRTLAYLLAQKIRGDDGEAYVHNMASLVAQLPTKRKRDEFEAGGGAYEESQFDDDHGDGGDERPGDRVEDAMPRLHFSAGIVDVEEPVEAPSTPKQAPGLIEVEEPVEAPSTSEPEHGLVPPTPTVTPYRRARRFLGGCRFES